MVVRKVPEEAESLRREGSGSDFRKKPKGTLTFVLVLVLPHHHHHIPNLIMSSLSIPADYAWVLLAAVAATGPLNVYQILLVSSARKAAGIKYPQLYPTPEES